MSLVKSNGGGLGGSGSPGGALGSFYSHTIDQSLRLDHASGAYLEIAEASPTATNRKKVTISCWVKRSGLSSEVNTVFWSTVNGLMLQFFAADNIYIYDNNAGGWQSTVTNGGRIFRDPSAWYHLALIIDTTQSTEANRAKFYINGELQTLNSYPSQNSDITWHDGSTMRIGNPNDTTDLAGYIAEFISIDGQDVAISDLGETKDGVWIPKDVSGLTLGNAGFYLPFSQDRTVSASAFFDEDDNSYVSFSNSSLYDIGTGDDFTLEYFFWPTVAQASGDANALGYYGGTSGPYFALQTSLNTRNFYLYYGNGQAYTFGTYASGAVDAGRWHHVAVNRASGTLEIFLDGTRVGSSITSNTQAWDTTEFRINKAHNTSNNTYDGYFSNVRLVIGSAVYSAGSSITVPTSPLTDITNTKLLACTTTTITQDASSNNVTGSASGTAGSGYYATDGLSPFPNGAFNEDAGSNGIDFSAKNIFDYDVVPDSPTNNFPTMNPLFPGNNATLGSGNLDVTPGGFTSSKYGTASTFAIPKDKKIYLEIECTDQEGNYWTAGFATKTSLENGPGSSNIGSSGAIMMYNRSVMLNGTENDYGSSGGLGGLGVSKFATGDILGMAIDGATGKVWFSRNGTYFGAPQGHQSGAGSTGDPAAGTNEIGTITGGTTDDVFVVVSGNSGLSVFVNFGQDSQNVASAQSDGEGIGTFEYAPPTGYVALCAANLTTTDIGPTKSSQADDNFNTVLYTGNASSRSITGVGFQPDWVWLKPRSDTDNHVFFDSVRGVQKFLYGNLGNAEATRSGDGLSSFDSDGFSIGDWNNINENTQTYVAWNWKAGGAPSADNSAAANAEPTAGSAKIDGSNRSGAFSGPPSIAIKRLSANTTAGFSIVRWTGTGSAGTVPHGLGAVPHFYVVKNLTDASTNWQAYHRGIASDAETDYIYLNDPAGADDSDDWNDTAPTANVFSVKTHNQVNASGDDYIAYVLSPIEGYSKFGHYLGNGSSSGTFVFTGFRPAWLLVKTTSSSNRWVLFDSVRSTTNPVEEKHELNPNDTSAEGTSGTDCFDFLSNGFKLRRTGDVFNTSGHRYIYLAFAEAPFKFANAR